MTTVAPIDVEDSEAAVLIDFENIRLSWEKAYNRLFRYTDLCWLCELVEQRFRISIGRIVVFMSDPKECEGTVGLEQLQEMKRILRLLEEDHLRTCNNRKGKPATTVLHSCGHKVPQHTVLYSDRQAKYGLSCLTPMSGIVTPNSEPCSSEEDCSELKACSDESQPRPSKRSFAPPETHVVELDSSSEEDETTQNLQLDNSKNGSTSITRQTVSLIEDKRKGTGSVNENIGSQKNDVENYYNSQSILLGNKSTISTESQSNSDATIDLDSAETIDEEMQSSSEDDEKPFVRLGESACSKAEVVVRVFGYKQNGRRRIQRCCDVAIGNEVTKICFMARFNSIFLFSADSDFEETARSCAEAEDFGGVIKYAKQIRVFGFSHAFEAATAALAREKYRRLRSKRLRQEPIEPESDVGVRVHFIDYEFPVIRRVLRRSPRPILYVRSTGNLRDPLHLRASPAMCADTQVAPSTPPSSPNRIHYNGSQSEVSNNLTNTANKAEFFLLDNVNDESCTTAANPPAEPNTVDTADSVTSRRAPPWRIRRPPLIGIQQPASSVTNNNVTAFPSLLKQFVTSPQPIPSSDAATEQQITGLPNKRHRNIQVLHNSSYPAPTDSFSRLQPPSDYISATIVTPATKKARSLYDTSSSVIDLSSNPEEKSSSFPFEAKRPQVDPWSSFQRCSVGALQSMPLIHRGPPPIEQSHASSFFVGAFPQPFISSTSSQITTFMDNNHNK